MEMRLRPWTSERIVRSLSDCVDVPAQECLSGAPIAIPLEKFLSGYRFSAAAGVVHIIIGAQDGIIDVEENVAQAVEPRGGTLAEEDFVINVYIGVRERV